MQRITPFIWFNDQAEEAVKFYTSVFKKSKVLKVSRYSEASANAAGRPRGSVMTIEFELDGQRFMALNGGPHLKITEAISFVVDCKTQKELDRFWTKLSAGGQIIQCGWLKDKYGVAWQVVPAILGDLMNGKDAGKADRVMQAVLKMKKLDIKKLKAAAAAK